MTPDPTDAPPDARRRLSVRGLMALVGLLGLAMGLGQFWLANRDPERALISQQLRILADRGAPALTRRVAVDSVAGARGRPAVRALRILAATLDDPDPVLRAASARAIGSIAARVLADSEGVSADAARRAAVALLGALDDPDRDVRGAALLGLSELIRFADGEKAALLDAETALPGLLGVVGEDHPAIIGPFAESWAGSSAHTLAGRFLWGDPVALGLCYELAATAEDGRTRRGAILCLDVVGDGTSPSSTAWLGGEARSVSDAELAEFLVDRLRSNPPGDRRAILHVLQEVGYRVPIAPVPLRGVADAADDDDPAVRWAASRTLIGQPASAGVALPGLLDGARRELDALDDFPASWAVLAIGPRSAAAAEVRSKLVAALGRPDAGGRRRRAGDVLLAHGDREPGILKPMLPALRRVGEDEVADEALDPVACEVVLRLAPDSAEGRALRSTIAEALEGTLIDGRRSALDEVYRLGRDPPVSPDRIAPPPPDPPPSSSP